MITTLASGDMLLRTVGLMADGPAVLGRPVRASGPGVYLVELMAPMARPPIDATVVGKWIERLPGMRLDGAPPVTRALVARLAAFWLPSSTVVFIGSSDTGIGGRIAALEKHVLGDRRPHAASQWLRTLRVDALRVWWANTDAPAEYEDALLAAFAESVPAAERAALHDPALVLPFANLRTPTGGRRQTGITGAVVPDEAAPPALPTHLTELPPGDATGIPEPRNGGTVRRTNVIPPPARRVGPRAATARTLLPRTTPRPATSRKAARPPTAPLQLTPDGHASLVAEHLELTQVKRPQVIERIVRARELGDLKENADYTSAREEQSFLEGRVQALEAQLRHAVIVATPSSTKHISLGSRVTAEANGDEVIFEIVGHSESNPAIGKISTASPVGKAMLGREVGDEAIVATPRGAVSYRILAIE